MGSFRAKNHRTGAELWNREERMASGGKRHMRASRLRELELELRARNNQESINFPGICGKGHRTDH